VLGAIASRQAVSRHTGELDASGTGSAGPALVTGTVASLSHLAGKTGKNRDRLVVFARHTGNHRSRA
jgi:hypothetical protein